MSAEPESLYARAIHAREAGDWPDAIALSGRVLDAEPRHAGAIELLALARDALRQQRLARPRTAERQPGTPVGPEPLTACPTPPPALGPSPAEAVTQLAAAREHAEQARAAAHDTLAELAAARQQLAETLEHGAREAARAVSARVEDALKEATARLTRQSEDASRALEAIALLAEVRQQLAEQAEERVRDETAELARRAELARLSLEGLVDQLGPARHGAVEATPSPASAVTAELAEARQQLALLTANATAEVAVAREQAERTEQTARAGLADLGLQIAEARRLALEQQAAFRAELADGVERATRAAEAALERRLAQAARDAVTELTRQVEQVRLSIEGQALLVEVRQQLADETEQAARADLVAFRQEVVEAHQAAQAALAEAATAHQQLREEAARVTREVAARADSHFLTPRQRAEAARRERQQSKRGTEPAS